MLEGVGGCQGGVRWVLGVGGVWVLLGGAGGQGCPGGGWELGVRSSLMGGGWVDGCIDGCWGGLMGAVRVGVGVGGVDGWALGVGVGGQRRLVGAGWVLMGVRVLSGGAQVGAGGVDGWVGARVHRWVPSGSVGARQVDGYPEKVNGCWGWVDGCQGVSVGGGWVPGRPMGGRGIDGWVGAGGWLWVLGGPMGGWVGRWVPGAPTGVAWVQSQLPQQPRVPLRRLQHRVDDDGVA